MSKVSICPNYFFFNKEFTPETIEKDFINPLNDFLDAFEKYGVQLYFEANIFNLILNDFPWNLYGDIKWRGYLETWNILLLSKIAKKSIIIDSLKTNESFKINCKNLSQSANELFSKFLNDFGQNRLPNGNFEEGIFIHHLCNQKQLFFNILSPTELIKVQFPWLQIYNESLPPNGDFPFIPPNNWRNSNIISRGVQNGFLDINQNEWCKDRLHHNNHWDVQLCQGGYKNITFDGRVL